MELLVTIALIAILAALLTSSVVHARRSARGVVCINNLRQITLSSLLYLNDHGYYIRHFYYLPVRTNNFWPDRLYPYTGSKWLDPLYKCPDNKLTNTGGVLFREGTLSLRGSYDMNSSGSALSFKYGPLGVGEIWVPSSNPDPNVGTTPVRDDLVVNPSQTYYYGDASMNVLGYPGSKFDVAAFYQLGNVNSSNISRRLEAQRHAGRVKVSMCDGHVETKKPSIIYSASAEERRHWNRDGEPHMGD